MLTVAQRPLSLGYLRAFSLSHPTRYANKITLVPNPNLSLNDTACCVNKTHNAPRLQPIVQRPLSLGESEDSGPYPQLTRSATLFARQMSRRWSRPSASSPSTQLARRKSRQCGRPFNHSLSEWSRSASLHNFGAQFYKIM